MRFQPACGGVGEIGAAGGVVRDVEAVVYKGEEGGEVGGGVETGGREELDVGCEVWREVWREVWGSG